MLLAFFIQRALQGHSKSTSRVLGHLSTRTLKTLVHLGTWAVKILCHSCTQGTWAFRHLRTWHLKGTWALKHLRDSRHLGTLPFRHLGTRRHLGSQALGHLSTQGIWSTLFRTLVNDFPVFLITKSFMLDVKRFLDSPLHAIDLNCKSSQLIILNVFKYKMSRFLQFWCKLNTQGIVKTSPFRILCNY